VPLQLLEDGRVVDHRAQAVGAQHEQVARLRGNGDCVHGDLGVRAESPGDDGAMRMLAGFVGREAARAH
jgi:hypothetical protein